MNIDMENMTLTDLVDYVAMERLKETQDVIIKDAKDKKAKEIALNFLKKGGAFLSMKSPRM